MNHNRTKRVISRLDELISRAEEACQLDPRHPAYSHILQYPQKARIWLTNVENLFANTFGRDNLYFKRLIALSKERSYEDTIILSWQAYMIAMKEDIEKGIISDMENEIAADIFDSMIETAESMMEHGKDIPAILCRIALEDTLIRLCVKEDLPSDNKAAVLNDSLRDNKIYNKPMWRTIQSFLDIGNAAAHGKFEEYSKEQVQSMIMGVREFIGTHL